MNLQAIYDIAQICHLHGIQTAVLSPGSRCAPLTLAFARHPHINCKTISDERSAAFIAMGMAQQTQRPVVLICTSGSAALNYGPAIAEAYFQHIPLIVLTADRPPEWIDQYDGQTIRQQQLYGKHVIQSFEFPSDLTHPDVQWHGERIMSEAINLASIKPGGPVHVNIPFREPFYPTADEVIGYSKQTKIFKVHQTTPTISEEILQGLVETWKQSHRKLIVSGQGQPSEQLLEHLNTLSDKQKVPVVGDVIANIHTIPSAILHADVFLGNDKKGLSQSLQPDLLITFGQSILSKSLKVLLRKYKPKYHWHIDDHISMADTYQSLTSVLHTNPEHFFERLATLNQEDSFDDQKQENYYHIWQIEERKSQRLLDNYFPQEGLGEFEMIHQVMAALPDDCNLHLANSMSVRYANIVGLTPSQKEITVYANRGTSGIDGSNSTAVGATLASDKLNVLITGDMAFFYDRNAFWHNYNLSNLKILILNNHAGGIFRMINGPREQPELEEFFETRQKLTAKLTAEEFGFEYMFCDRKTKLKNYIAQFLEDDSLPKILEIESSSKNNFEILTNFKSAYKELK